MRPEDHAQTEAVLAAVTGVVGDGVVGAYLYGSGVLAKLRPRSDIDVFVLVDRPTIRAERGALVEQIMPVSGRRPHRPNGRPVEVTMARWDEVRPWRPTSRREFQYGEWLRNEYESGFVPDPVEDPDLAPLIATLLTASRALIGPPAAVVLDPVPAEDLVSAMRRGVPALLDDLADDTVNVLLTLARVAYTTAHGSIVTKDEAAAWAMTKLPEDGRAPLEWAMAVYLGEPEKGLEDPEAGPRRTAGYLVARLIEEAGI